METIYEQIARYLSGEMSDMEIVEFMELVESSEENQQLFEELKNDWNKLQPMKNNRNLNVDKAWSKLSDRLEGENLIPKKKKKGLTIQLSYAMRIAAVFIGLVAITSMYYMLKNQDSVKYITVATIDGNEHKTCNLPDGSVVYLNGTSKLTYPEQFTGDKRNVTLEGEAFFEIKRNEVKPFVIEANHTEIKVLGTSFNVNATAKQSVEVSVKTGKVQFRSLEKEDAKVVLVAGEKGQLANEKMTKSQTRNENYLAWKTRKLDFDGERLSEIIATINQVYGVNIKTNNNQIDTLVLGKTTFDNLPLETILDLLCATFNLKFEKNKNEIILR